MEDTVAREEIGKAIGGIFDGIIAAVGKKNADAYASRAETPEGVAAVAALRAGDFEGWNRALSSDWDACLDGMVEHVFPGNSKAQFAARHREFLARHIRETIKEHEGWTSYYDKASKVLGKLTVFLVTGRPIVYDPKTENEFSRPKKVFTAHDEIVAFFEAVHKLYYGRGGDYLTLVSDMRKRLR